MNEADELVRLRRDIDGHQADDDIRRTLEKLHIRQGFVKILGSYPKDSV